jgi:hypothetical protein
MPSQSGEMCSFCGENPGVVSSPSGMVSACRKCCGPHGEVQRLFEAGQKARRPDWDEDQDEDRDALAKRVGLTDDDSPVEEIAMSLLDQLYPLPRASHTTRAQQFPTIVAQLKFQRARSPAGRRAAQLSVIDALARRQGQMAPSDVRDLVRRAGLATA